MVGRQCKERTWQGKKGELPKWLAPFLPSSPETTMWQVKTKDLQAFFSHLMMDVLNNSRPDQGMLHKSCGLINHSIFLQTDQSKMREWKLPRDFKNFSPWNRTEYSCFLASIFFVKVFFPFVYLLHICVCSLLSLFSTANFVSSCFWCSVFLCYCLSLKNFLSFKYFLIIDIII